MPKPHTKGKPVQAAVLVLALLPLIALARPAPPSEAHSGLSTIEQPPALDPCPLSDQAVTPAASCTGGCVTPQTPGVMHIADLTGEVSIDPYGKYLLVVYVVVHDQDHAPLGQVEVDASIWCPDGGPAHRARMTHSNGSARFHWGATVTGRWKLCVDSLTREGYLYDPGVGEVAPCAEWSN